MPINKIVVHEKSGTVIKGTTADFLPKRPLFHLSVSGMHSGEMKKIFIEDLKAVFFVRDFSGNKDYKETKSPNGLPGSGKKIQAVFKDGEAISGYTHVFNMDQPGFFLIPLDQKSNNERIYIVFSSLSTLEVDGSPIKLTH